MIDTVIERLNMSVKHCTCAPATHFVPSAVSVEPFFGSFFATADLVAHDRVENFRAATGHRTETSIAQSLKRIPDGHAENSLRQVSNLDGGKGLDM